MAREGIPNEVRCAHILLKHVGSRNPINRNTNKPVTRTKSEAIAEMRQHLQVIRASAAPDREFKNLAIRISECSSARSGGDLGFFTKDKMQKAFSDVAFSLDLDEVSNIVDSDSGIHLIYRIE